jgi:shikimate dehydrogenase
MRLFALIGYPLGHSFSKQYFTEKFTREGIIGANYELFPLENISMLPALLKAHPNLEGLNVTIPYKETVIPYLDDLDETARAAEAVNCIRIRDRKLTGFNTDVWGFRASLLRQLDKPPEAIQLALILGTGGASKAVAFVLRQLGVPFHFISRAPAADKNELGYADLHQLLPQSNLIVDTTPLGMAPNTETCPDIPFELLGSQHFVFDLVYNPAETLLLRRARACGSIVSNGLEMLHLQAEKAWEIWNMIP